MVKKVKREASNAQSTGLNPAALADSIKASAQQIYLAGLAQFSKAQQNGSAVFENLVKEGLAVQRRTQAAAEERINEVAAKAASMANEVTAKATGQWNKLEDIFEERVARALNKLGVPSAQDIQALSARVDALSQQTGRKKPAAGTRTTTQAKTSASRVNKKPAKKAASAQRKTAAR